jgi:hypothetical protein
MIAVKASKSNFLVLGLVVYQEFLFSQEHAKVYDSFSSTDLRIDGGCGLKTEPIDKWVRFAQVFHRGPLQL